MSAETEAESKPDKQWQTACVSCTLEQLPTEVDRINEDGSWELVTATSTSRNSALGGNWHQVHLFLKRRVAAVERDRGVPHRCPVCEGIGQRQFRVEGMGLVASETCGACNGAGIIWSKLFPKPET